MSTRERILVLDDESSILELLAQFLEEEGYAYTTTTSPHRALDMLGDRSFALLLTDLKMPEMTGLEVIRRARRKDPDLAVIVVTALLSLNNAVEALRYGADDYVTKPFNLDEISLSIHRALERRRLVRENREYQETLERRVREAVREVEQKNLELRTTKDYLENLINSTVDAIITVDLQRRITFINDGGLAMLGASRADVVDKRLDDMMAGDGDDFEALQALLREQTAPKRYESAFMHANGHPVPVSISLSPVLNPEGTPIASLAICKDITEQKKLENELKEMSIRDSLTGLYNQRYFHERLPSEIERARRQRHPLALLVLDLDNFKPFNDTRGHLEGDRALQKVGEAILQSTREYVDLGFRYGGDEFTILLPEAGIEQALQVAARIQENFKAAKMDNLTLSMGAAALFDGMDGRQLMQAADAMMYKIKRAGGGDVAVSEAPSSEVQPNSHKEAAR